MRPTLALVLVFSLLAISVVAPTAAAKPDPPQCVIAPCCAEGDLSCRIDYYVDKATREACRLVGCS